MPVAKVARADADLLEKRDQQLHAKATKKLLAGQTLTHAEDAAYRRYEKVRKARDRDELLRALPIGEYCRLSGRQLKVVREQAERYGLPLTERTVDVGEVLTAFHDILRDHGRKIATPDVDDPLLVADGGISDGLEEYRRESAKVKRLQREQMEGTLVARDDVHELLSRVAGSLRSLGEDLERKQQRDAFDLLQATIDSVERETRSFFGGRDAA